MGWHICNWPTYPGFRLLSQKLMRPSERHSSRGCSSALGSRSSVASRSDWASRTTVAEQLVSYSIITSDEWSLNIMATSTLAVAFSWKRRGTVWSCSNGRRSDWCADHKKQREEVTRELRFVNRPPKRGARCLIFTATNCRNGASELHKTQRRMMKKQVLNWMCILRVCVCVCCHNKLQST